jgi:glyoxylase-like metal-dependent hydrolase (beta-lactamase superfamily II)
MVKKRIPSGRRSVIGLLAMAMAFAVSAEVLQENRSPATGGGDVTLTADLVKTGLYVITGGGGNTLMRFSANGLILVDGKLPGNYKALMSRVRKLNKLSDLPVRVLIVTNHHETHAGNNAQFLAAGIPIIAQENARNRLRTYQPAANESASPVVAFEREYTLRLGGVEVQLRHFGNARTDGDTVVYFANLKAIAVGDLFTPDTPRPDFLAGGSFVGWAPVLAQVLKLDFDVVMPSTGPMVTRADLEAFKTKIDALVSRATALVRNGVAKDQLMAQLATDDLGWRFSFTSEEIDRFYAELSESIGR